MSTVRQTCSSHLDISLFGSIFSCWLKRAFFIRYGAGMDISSHWISSRTVTFGTVRCGLELVLPHVKYNRGSRAEAGIVCSFSDTFRVQVYLSAHTQTDGQLRKEPALLSSKLHGGELHMALVCESMICVIWTEQKIRFSDMKASGSAMTGHAPKRWRALLSAGKKKGSVLDRIYIRSMGLSGVIRIDTWANCAISLMLKECWELSSLFNWCNMTLHHSRYTEAKACIAMTSNMSSQQKQGWIDRWKAARHFPLRVTLKMYIYSSLGRQLASVTTAESTLDDMRQSRWT